MQLIGQQGNQVERGGASEAKIGACSLRSAAARNGAALRLVAAPQTSFALSGRQYRQIRQSIKVTDGLQKPQHATRSLRRARCREDVTKVRPAQTLSGRSPAEPTEAVTSSGVTRSSVVGPRG
jgi:hypothetical protein